MSTYPRPLYQLIQLLKKLPGVGTKTAERFAFQLLDWKTTDLKLLGFQLTQLKESIQNCKECGCLKEKECFFCGKPERNFTSLCIVSSSKDVFSIEETKVYHGLFHVIPSLLSPFEGGFETQVDLNNILERINRYQIKEVILALESTLEGDATALYLKEQLSERGILVSRLAFGIPLGSTLDFVDGGTLSRAFTGRQPV